MHKFRHLPARHVQSENVTTVDCDMRQATNIFALQGLCIAERHGSLEKNYVPFEENSSIRECILLSLGRLIIHSTQFCASLITYLSVWRSYVCIYKCVLC